MKFSINLVYRLYKRYTIFLLIIVIIISWKLIIQNVLNRDKKNVDMIHALKKHVSYQHSDFIKVKGYDNNIIYSYIVKKQASLYKEKVKAVLYNYSVLSSDMLLGTILQKCSNGVINTDDVYQLIYKYPVLQHLKFGQTLSCLVINQKTLQCLIWRFSPEQIYIYKRSNNDFTEGIIKILAHSKDRSCYTILYIGELDETFINSARTLGLEENCILDVIKALKYHLDFRKLSYGDRFSILVSCSFIKEKQQLHSKLIGARLYTSGKDYYIFQFGNGKFYNRDAVHLADHFIRFPILAPYRISSNFNLKRLNPITRQISPHAGIDFAVPVGTPVLSVGDGEVIISKYGKIAGNYIGIKHNHQCVTRYMHLQKILVKLGQKVKKGDQIALSGNTGRSTGPHLHFEVWINHRPVNPLTTNIFCTERLLGHDRIQLLHQIEEIIPKLRFD